MFVGLLGNVKPVTVILGFTPKSELLPLVKMHLSTYPEFKFVSNDPAAAQGTSF